jgi:photosystem II stability/assembly factor-like uncharacterized protein
VRSGARPHAGRELRTRELGAGDADGDGDIDLVPRNDSHPKRLLANAETVRSRTFRTPSPWTAPRGGSGRFPWARPQLASGAFRSAPSSAEGNTLCAMRGPTPSATLRLPAALPICLAAVLAGRAEAAQWREVAAPEVGPVAGLSSPHASQPFVASLPTSSQVTIPGASTAWSADGGVSWVRRHNSTTPVLRDIEHHPTDPQVLWGAASSVWKSVDGGRSWDKVYTSGYGAVDALAVDPGNPGFLYGVGQPILPGGSLHRSRDGGLTWQPSDPYILVSTFDVLVVPGSPLGAVVMATDAGIFRSTDGGTTFDHVLPGVDAFKLALAAHNPRSAWCIARSARETTELWRSRDGGLSWSSTPTPAGDVTDVVAHGTDPDLAWVVSEAQGAFYTLDGGQTWGHSTGISPIANLTSIVLSPVSAGTLLAGGEGGDGGIWRSTDGGLSWRRSNHGLPTPIPNLRFDGLGRVYAVGLGVPVRSDATAPAWELMDYAGGVDSTAASLGVRPGEPGTLAWVDEGPEYWKANRLVVTLDDGATWHDVTPIAGDSTSTWEVRRVAFGASGTLYAGTQYGFLHRSDDVGQTWVTSQAPWTFLRELVPDPHDEHRLHATDVGLYATSFDQGQTWTVVFQSERSGQWYPDDFTVSPAVPERFFVLSGQPEKRLLRSDDGGATWSVTGDGLPPGRLNRLAIDPTDPARMLVGTDGAGAYISRDGGARFLPWNAGIEDATVVSVAFDPLRAGVAWLSTTDGRLFVRAAP